MLQSVDFGVRPGFELQLHVVLVMKIKLHGPWFADL